MRIAPLTILLLPLALFCASEGPLKSAITVERGEYRKGWERDFFRETDREPVPIETPDALAAPVPDHATTPAADQPRPRKSAPSPHRREAGTLPALPPSSEKNTEPVPEPAPAPPPLEQLPPTPHRTEPQVAPEAPREPAPPPEAEQIGPDDETKKKQKERSRELENRRKKGNFRDPKITY